MRILAALQAVMLLAPALAAAQATAIPTWPVAEGARVRVLSPALGDDPRVGRVVSATNDSLSFRARPQSAPYATLGTSDIRRLELSRDRHSHRLIGGLVGFPLGAVAGGFMGAASVDKGRGDARFDAGRSGAVVGGVVGAIAGMLTIGRTVEKWVPVALPGRP